MSKIEWCDRSDWNPIRGCTRASEGCRNCYAEAIAARFSGPGQPWHGFAEKTASGPRWTGKVELIEDRLTLPLKWRKPAKIFTNSASDLFHESVPDEWIDRVFAVMALAPQHTFQVLTKRSRRMREYLSDGRRPYRVARAVLDIVIADPVRQAAQMGGKTWPVESVGWIDDPADVTLKAWPLANVWAGVTAEDQTRADERIPDLLATPAALRFVSVEPMLGAVDLKNITPADKCELDALSGFDFDQSSVGPRLDWVICGGESGPGARPMQVGLARSIVAQCRDARVPCFVKQLGSDPVWEDGAFLNLRHRKGATMSEWPADLHVQEIPNAR